jgi:hypothetical protein
MAVVDGRTWLEHLDARRCWELLASLPVGRIGVLRGLLRSPAVCFEVDGVDPEDGTAGACW